MQRRKKWTLLTPLCLVLITAAVLDGCSPRDPGHPTPEMCTAQVVAPTSMGVIYMREIEFRQDKLVNQDGDWNGEFGLLGELTGEIVPRCSLLATPLPNPLLAHSYNTGGANGPGCAYRQGYFFRIYLPASPDTAGDDRTLGGTRSKPGPEVRRDVVNLQEQHFALYAWPRRRGTIPKYAIAFFINELGRLHRQKGTKYIGRDNGPPAEAAYVSHVFTSDIDTSEWAPLYGATPRNSGKPKEKP